ncbi:MAG: hypothetical protein Q8O67_18140 [Deltaproteobacteria bacterium]|nr:hypothetical protein [Deltaproteobacteria bacterium]
MSHRVVVVVVVGLVVLSGIFEIGDPDLWWHIGLGRWLWQHGSLPADLDPFAWTATGPCSAYEPLAELSFFAADAAGGVVGILLLKLALIGALFASLALLLARKTRDGLAVAVVVALVGCASHEQLLERPYLASFLFFALAVRLAVDVEAGLHRRVWLFPLLVLVWMNVHRSAGLGVGGCVVAVAFMVSRDRSSWRTGVVVCALSLVAMFLTPGSTYAVESIFTSLSGREHDLSAIDEWAPTTIEHLLFDVPALLPLAALALIDLRRRRPFSWVSWAFVAAGVVVGYRARFLPYLAIALAVPAVGTLELWGTQLRKSVRPGVLAAVVVVAAAAALWWQYESDLLPSARQVRLAPRLPFAAARFLQEQPPPADRLWNDFDFGGALLYALGPEIKISIDGRTGNTIYGYDFFDDALRARTDPVILDRFLDEGHVDVVVALWRSFDDGFYRGLRSSPQWRLVFWDDVSTVHVRATSTTNSYIEKHGYRALRVDTALQDLGAFSPERFDPALMQELERNAQQAPSSSRAHALLYLALRARGDLERAPLARARAFELAHEADVDLSLP